MTSIFSFTLTLSLLGAAASLAAGCGADVATGGTSSDGTSGTSSSTGAGGGCTVDTPCANNGVCFLPQGACSPSDKGTCQDGFSCDGPPSGPVCGCDGKVIEADSASCSFLAAGKPYAFAGGCQTGTFPCGPMLQCGRNSDVCQVTLPGVPGPASYACVALEKFQKAYCLGGIPDCSCLNTEGSCNADADHQETVSIALP